MRSFTELHSHHLRSAINGYLDHVSRDYSSRCSR
jgi:hypothetical protein